MFYTCVICDIGSIFKSLQFLAHFDICNICDICEALDVWKILYFILSARDMHPLIDHQNTSIQIQEMQAGHASVLGHCPYLIVGWCMVTCRAELRCSVSCVVCSVQCVVCSVQCAVYSVRCTVCGGCSVLSGQCAVFSLKRGVCSVQCAACSMQFAMCSVQFLVCSV